jgi:signal transduction histidine kinase
MPQYELILHQGEKHLSTYDIGSDGLVIGRASECDVVLVDSMVSRRHARIWNDGKGLKIEDLGARNGIVVNGHKVSKLRVDEGDELTVGTHTFRIAKVTREHAKSDTGATISFEKAGDIHERMLREPDFNRLVILYKASQLLGTVFDLNDLLDRILELLFEALPVKRGFILTLSGHDKTPEVRACLPNDKGADRLPMSQTLIDHVFSQRSAVLTLDAHRDFSESESVVTHGIRAAMCVPLCGREDMVGAIYVDSGKSDIVFKNDHLKLLTAIGRVTGVAVENANLHQEMVETERLSAIGQATAGLGHCVKNILVGIKGGAEFVDLALETGEIKYIQKGWPLIRRSVDRVEDLVLNLLTFSRNHRTERTNTDLNLLVDEIKDTVAAQATLAKVTLKVEKGDLRPMPLDSLGMYRAILNLVGNAIDACEEHGGHVTLRTKADESSYYVEVEDDGTGIPEEFRDRLFKAFNSTKGSKGTGLGLACSQKIVHEHGGFISFTTKPGKGSKFVIQLPTQTMIAQSS